jgi:hypothetical protein
VVGNESVTLVKYYKSFRSTFGVMAGVFSTVPLWSRLLPDTFSSYVFPPVGSIEGPARIGAAVTALAFTYFAFFAGAPPGRMNRKRIACAIIFAPVCLFAYLAFYFCFVREIEIPAKGTSVQVSVGYERTPFALKTFDSESDWDLLEARGFGEEDIQKLWTAKSLLVSRLSLVITYCLFIISLTVAFSWGVLEQCNRRA